jgi:hypothetical protein
MCWPAPFFAGCERGLGSIGWSSVFRAAARRRRAGDDGRARADRLRRHTHLKIGTGSNGRGGPHIGTGSKGRGGPHIGTGSKGRGGPHIGTGPTVRSVGGGISLPRRNEGVALVDGRRPGHEPCRRKRRANAKRRETLARTRPEWPGCRPSGRYAGRPAGIPATYPVFVRASRRPPEDGSATDPR